MFNQHAKWLDIFRNEVLWRVPISSLNILLSSTVWRQGHNSFSHQEPGFLDYVTNKSPDVVRVYIPPDANCLLSVANHCLHSTNYKRTNRQRIHVLGYKEKGNINKPLELAIRNQTDRFNLVIDVIDRVPKLGAAGAYIKEKMKTAIIENLQFLGKRGSIEPKSRAGLGLTNSCQTAQEYRYNEGLSH
jgi:phosphoketolase